MRTGMGEPRKIYSSEKIGGRNTETITRSSHRTVQVNRTDARGPIIHDIHKHIGGGLQKSVDGRYIGTGNHCMEKIMDLRGQIVTNI